MILASVLFGSDIGRTGIAGPQQSHAVAVRLNLSVQQIIAVDERSGVVVVAGDDASNWRQGGM